LRTLYLYQGFDQAVIETSDRTRGLEPTSVSALQSYEMRLCALFMPPFSHLIVSRTFLEEAEATRLSMQQNRALCETGFIRLVPKVTDPQTEKEIKKENYKNVRSLRKYHRAYYDVTRAPVDYSSFDVTPKDFETGKLAHSLWVDQGRGLAIDFMVEKEFGEWLARISDLNTGNSTWEATRNALLDAEIPAEMLGDLHRLSFTTYADGHRHNGVGVITGSTIANGLFTGRKSMFDYDLTRIRDFCQIHGLGGDISRARDSEIVAVRTALVGERSVIGNDGAREGLTPDLAVRVKKLLTIERRKRMPDFTPIKDRRFKVALTFPGTHRHRVKEIWEQLIDGMSVDEVFYDFAYKADLAGPNLDLKLQMIYKKQSELLVAFLAPEYKDSDWCGLEWRVVRDFIKARKDEQILFLRLAPMTDEEVPEGLLSVDGYVDIAAMSSGEVAEIILRRYLLLQRA
jgi:hypothetical protein